MKPILTSLLATALLAVMASSQTDCPEPPPPVKVSGTKQGINVKVKAGAGGPLLTIDQGKITGTGSFQLEFAEKNAPAKITLRFTNLDQLAVFALMGKEVKTERILLRPNGTAKQTFHYDAQGKVLAGEKGARLSITYSPKKDEVEVVMVRHKGQKWPEQPLRVLWSKTLGKKKG